MRSTVFTIVTLCFTGSCSGEEIERQHQLPLKEQAPGSFDKERTVCSTRDGGPPESYRFDVLNRKLSMNPAVRSVTGVESVEDCESARIAATAITYNIELEPPSEDLSGSTDTEDELNVESATIDDPLAPDYHGPIIDRKIWHGKTLLGRRALIRIIVKNPGVEGGSWSCGGILINSHWLLTSAHCVDAWVDSGDFGNGDFSVEMNYPPDGSVHCLSNGWAGSCSHWYTYLIFLHPDYSGGYDVEDDVALIWSLSSWNPFQDVDYGRLYVGSMSLAPRNWHFGYGPDVEGCDPNYYNDELRWGYIDNDWYGAKHWYGNADSDYRICEGDSGGPGTRWDNWDMQLGLASDFEGYGCCADSGGKQRFTRINAKIPWIQQTTNSSCPQYVSPTYGYLYRKCST